MTKTIVDIHIIQTVPPSCVNRDDTGRPKTAQYGGVQRARVSSQAWKKAVRDYFRDKLGNEQVGIRTLNYAALIAKEIVGQSEVDFEQAEQLAQEVLSNAGITKGGALFFISRPQISALAKLAIDHPEDEKDYKKLAKEYIKKNNSIDIALFGRMVADDASLNSDASCQVAHAISVDVVENEFDFYTALDDDKIQDENSVDAGAGMLGTVEFNSSTLYRYATVYVDLLEHELSNDSELAVRALRQFIKGFVLSMPMGKQNTFANNALPSAVYVTIREDQPVNFVNAFETPVEGKDISAQALDILSETEQKTYDTFVSRPIASFLTTTLNNEDLFISAERVSLDELVGQVGDLVLGRLA